ncbi:hypothetical protein FRB98_003865, partial [Tulasnella sp. 332]
MSGMKLINIWTITASSILPKDRMYKDGWLQGLDIQTHTVIDKGEDGRRTLDRGAHNICEDPCVGKLLPNADRVKMYDYEADPQSLGAMLSNLMMMTTM